MPPSELKPTPNTTPEAAATACALLERWEVLFIARSYFLLVAFLPFTTAYFGASRAADLAHAMSGRTSGRSNNSCCSFCRHVRLSIFKQPRVSGLLGLLRMDRIGNPATIYQTRVRGVDIETEGDTAHCNTKPMGNRQLRNLLTIAADRPAATKSTHVQAIHRILLTAAGSISERLQSSKFIRCFSIGAGLFGI